MMKLTTLPSTCKPEDLKILVLPITGHISSHPTHRTITQQLDTNTNLTLGIDDFQTMGVKLWPPVRVEKISHVINGKYHQLVAELGDPIYRGEIELGEKIVLQPECQFEIDYYGIVTQLQLVRPSVPATLVINGRSIPFSSVGKIDFSKLSPEEECLRDATHLGSRSKHLTEEEKARSIDLSQVRSVSIQLLENEVPDIDEWTGQFLVKYEGLSITWNNGIPVYSY